VVNSSTDTTGWIIQYPSGTLAGNRMIEFHKADESSASSLTIGSGVLTFNATSAGDWFQVYSGYKWAQSPITYDLSAYNAFQVTVLSAPAGADYVGFGAGDPSIIASGALASIPPSGSGPASAPFSWWDWSGVDFHHIYAVEFECYADVPGTYVFDNFQAVLVPEPATLTLGLLGALALWLRAAPSRRRLGD